MPRRRTYVMEGSLAITIEIEALCEEMEAAASFLHARNDQSCDIKQQQGGAGRRRPGDVSEQVSEVAA